MRTLKLDHIAMLVPNVEETIQFYKEVLGYQIIGEFTRKNGVTFYYLENNGIVYEFFERSCEPILLGKIDHVAYASSDIHADYEYYKQQGCLVDDSGVKYVDSLWGEGVDYFFIQSPSNELIEFCQKR